MDCYVLWTVMTDDSCHVYVDCYMLLDCGMSVNFGYYAFLPRLYCVPIHEITHTTRGVSKGPLTRLGVYLRITCTVKGQLYYIRDHPHN